MTSALSLDKRLTWLTLVVLPLLTGLGFWQLARAEEKRALQVALEQRQQQPPTPLVALPADRARRFMPVGLTGQFDAERRFLLDNQVRDGQVGYDVLVPFRYGDQEAQWVLVNRGWVAAPARRDELPVVPPEPEGEVTLSGQLHIPDGEPLQLAPQTKQDDDWPKVVQVVDTEQFAAWLDRPLYPHTVRIAVDHPVALMALWDNISVPAEKHIGYAVQWFGMAIALIIWYLLANTALRPWFRQRFHSNTDS